MPYKIAKRGKKFRILDQNGRIAKNRAGTAMDGGGHNTERGAKRQVNAVSMSERGIKPKRGK